jgi:penicillin-binding protein 2
MRCPSIVRVLPPALWQAVSLCLVLTLTAGCAGPLALFQPEPTPTPVPPRADLVALNFFKAWGRGDFGALYDLLSANSQAGLTREELIAFFSQVYDDAGIYAASVEMRAVLQKTDEAQVAYHVSYDSGAVGRFEADNTLPLTLESEAWRVKWSPTIIWPQLAPGNRFKIVEQLPSRGNIYDRNGLGLAEEGLRVTVGVVPGKIPAQSTVLASLATVTGLSLSDIRAKIDKARPDWFVPLKDMPVDEYEQVGGFLESLPGVVPRQAYTRAYNDNGVAAHIVGYVGPIREEELAAWKAKGYRGSEVVGQDGLERLADPYLTGRKGGTVTVVDAHGEVVGTVMERDALPSRNIITTLDRNLQEAARSALGDRRGAIVALDPGTGEVLALASSPSYDPNQLIGDVKASQWHNMLTDPNRPLLNRVTQGTYPPGSIFKIVTESAALEAGGYEPTSPFTCGGVWYGLGAQWAKVCWLATGHGKINLQDGLTGSCDIVFYEVGKHLGELDPSLLGQYARGFGLGRPTGLEGFDEAGGVVPDPTWKTQNVHETWYPGDSVNMAIGQGYMLVTPLQMAVMLAAVANGGTLYQPQLVRRIDAAGDEPEIRPAPKPVGKLPITAEHLQVIQKALLGVTSGARGTALQAFKGFPVKVAGKTGTAENQAEDPHAWFAGYAPADKPPQIAIAVLIEQAGEGSEAAAPVFRRVAEAFFGIQPPPPTPTATVRSGVAAPTATVVRAR